MARWRQAAEAGFLPGSLLISLGLHGVLAVLVLLWGGLPKPTASPVLTVSLVAPGPELSHGPGDAPALAGVQKAKAPLQSAAPAPAAQKPPEAVRKKPRKRSAPPLPRPKVDMAMTKPLPQPAPPPVAKNPPPLTSPHSASAPSPTPSAGSGTAGASSAQFGSQAGLGSGSPTTAVLGFGRVGGGGGGNAAKAQSNYLQLIRARILAQRAYPYIARQRHQEGVVRLRFTLSPAGGPAQGVEVVKPSGFTVLDDQARQAVLGAAPFPPFPPDLQQDRLTVEVPIVYRLTDGGM